MKNSTSTVMVKARTAGTVRKQQIEWKRVVMIGIDVGDRFSHYCAIDSRGEIVAEGRIATTAGAFELELGRVRRTTIADLSMHRARSMSSTKSADGDAVHDSHRLSAPLPDRTTTATVRPPRRPLDEPGLLMEAGGDPFITPAQVARSLFSDARSLSLSTRRD